jgi:phosphate uptake regulator
MSLESVYSKQVQQTGSVNLLPNYGRPPVIERDPNIDQLEQNVFQQLMNVIAVEEPVAETPATPSVQMVSFEDALKELAQMNK